MRFNSLGLSEEILSAIKVADYERPTLIQQQVIPAILAGKDLLASVQTGTGKTAGFVLCILQHLSQTTVVVKGRKPVRALILAPTRELAAQVAQNVCDYSQFLRLKSLVVFGGVSINPQMMKLRGGVDILVATPGRLPDFVQQNSLFVES